MGCLRVKKLNEYLHEPLSKCLNDKDAYVRKTAAFCVPKVYEQSPELIEQNNIIAKLQEMVHKESNVIVLSNAIWSLYDLGLMKKQNLINIDRSLLNRLLTAVNDCNEWGQTFILEVLANYIPKDSNETEEYWM